MKNAFFYVWMYKLKSFDHRLLVILVGEDNVVKNINAFRLYIFFAINFTLQIRQSLQERKEVRNYQLSEVT